MSTTHTRTYTVRKPKHLVRRTARLHAWALNTSYYGRGNFPFRNRRYEVKDLGRGPFRWAVVDWGTRP